MPPTTTRTLAKDRLVDSASDIVHSPLRGILDRSSTAAPANPTVDDALLQKEHRH
jgi:hypothetical protein